MLVNDEKYVHNLSVFNIKEKLTNWAAMRQGTLHISGWAELGAPGIPRGPHLFGFYVVKKLKM